MKQQLKKIYQDLSNGKLTQNEALNKIKALKLQEQEKRIGTLLSTPTWEESNIVASSNADNFVYTEQHIILCELQNINVKQIEKLVPRSHCLSLQS